MNQPFCPRCHKVNPPTNSFCSQCGTSLDERRLLERPPHSVQWKWPLALFLMVASSLWVGAFYSSSHQSSITAPASTTTQPNTFAAAATPPPSATQLAQTAGAADQLTLTAGQHLAEARRVLAASGKDKPNSANNYPAALAAARWHLEQVTAKDKEFSDAQKLLASLVKRERDIATAAAVAAAAERVKQVKAAEALASGGGEDENEANEPSDSAVSGTASSDGATKRTGGGSSSTVDLTPQVRSSANKTSDSSSDYYTNGAGNSVHRPTFSESVPAGASARCGDGSYSFSQSRRGTCSHHGGVAAWL